MLKFCEICKKNLIPVLNLGKHPLCDDLIKIKSKKKNKFYKIEILLCKKCFTAYQKYQVSKKILFPSSYHYRSRLTNDVIDGMTNLVKQSKNILGNLKDKKVLDVGCNDGSLLNIFKKQGAITIGIEPTNAANEAKPYNHDIYKNYIDKKTLTKIKNKYQNVDIITFTNVFAHIENLNQLLKNLKIIISENTFLIIENHYLGSILRKNQFDTFYHEHPRTYSLNSFLKISKVLGMNLYDVKFPKRYGGNIRIVFSMKEKNLKLNKILKKEKFFFNDFKKLEINLKKWQINKKNIINKFVKKYGPLYAKAFPGRAAILIKLLNLDSSHIKQVFEKKKSPKIGYYVPGTNIPIESDININKINKKIPIINFAWHIKKEIKLYLKRKKIKNKVVDIINNKDFTYE